MTQPAPNEPELSAINEAIALETAREKRITVIIGLLMIALSIMMVGWIFYFYHLFSAHSFGK